MSDVPSGWRNWQPVFTATGILGLFALLGATLVGLGYEGTVDRIANNEREALLHQLIEIVPREICDNDMLTDTLDIEALDYLGSAQTTVYRARLNNKPLAAIFSPVIANGYSGNIHLLVGVNIDGSIAGVRVLKHKETPGLGDKIELQRDPWIKDFDGKSLTQPKAKDWRVLSDGGIFDQFTGATITPRAVVDAVKQTLDYFALHKEQIFADNLPITR